MSKKIVRRDVDLANLSPLTEKQKSELAALAARPDGAVDYSNIPPLTDDFWNDAACGWFYKPIKGARCRFSGSQFWKRGRPNL